MTSNNDKVNYIRRSPSSVIETPPTDEVPSIDALVIQDSHRQEEDSPWICPASQKSLRTTNPIRAIVDPIVASSLGEERHDGKSHISLAVSVERLVLLVIEC